MKIKKRVAAVLITCIIAGSSFICLNGTSAINVSAETAKSSASSDVKNGWYNTSDGKKIYYKDGEKIVSKTALIDNKIYLFDKDGYLLAGGFHTVNNKKYYSNKEGRVLCNQWIGSSSTENGYIYYYATSSGVIKSYEIRYEKAYSSFNYYYSFLYIDGKKATGKDLSSESGLYQMCSDIYYLVYSDYSDYFYNTDTRYSNNWVVSHDMYDIGSGKKICSIKGMFDYDKYGCITNGWLMDGVNHICYNIQNKKYQLQKISSPLIILDTSTKLNSVGGLNYSPTVANNSEKTINYIHYKIHVVNRVGDTVYDTISDKSTFYLQDTGPYEPGDIIIGGWDALMYNYSANKVVIDSVTIDYSDGTSATYKGSSIYSFVK